MLIHGGAWAIPDEEVADHLDGLRGALVRGHRALERGASALDTVEEAVHALERHPAFDAGRGSVLDADGLPQLDAGIMDGPTLRWGSVANVRHLQHPIAVARKLLEGDGQARLLVGEGAERFAAEHGFPHVEPRSHITAREQRRFEHLCSDSAFHTSGVFDAPRGTVGCVALDASGSLAAATSTGGTPLARSGRVGDSPIPGAGFYADESAAASATGWGEAITTVQLCADACRRVSESVAPDHAAARALARMRERIQWPGAARASGGLIVLRSDGSGGWAFTSPRMARAGWTDGGEPWMAVEPSERIAL